MTAPVRQPDQHDGLVTVTRSLPGSGQSASAARSMIASALADCTDDTIAMAQLLVSELVTNAVLHARTGLLLKIELDSSVVRISVEDGSSASPQPHPSSVDALGGRGLSLVKGLSSAWGWDRIGGGKQVWFELAFPTFGPAVRP
jgi:anti-sigma regulatory factor (Ser/Thr protein kinase)